MIAWQVLSRLLVLWTFQTQKKVKTLFIFQRCRKQIHAIRHLLWKTLLFIKHRTCCSKRPALLSFENFVWNAANIKRNEKSSNQRDVLSCKRIITHYLLVLTGNRLKSNCSLKNNLGFDGACTCSRVWKPNHHRRNLKCHYFDFSPQVNKLNLGRPVFTWVDTELTGHLT